MSRSGLSTGLRNQNCVFACGHSILEPLVQDGYRRPDAAAFGGGGHRPAGTVQVPYARRGS